MPLNFQSFFNRSVSNHLLPVAGTPSTSLNELMMEATPASTAALYGAKYSLYILILLISTVL